MSIAETINGWRRRFRLGKAIKVAQGGRRVSLDDGMTTWITPELLKEHNTFPYDKHPQGFRSYAMNLHPKDKSVNFWSMGKSVQSTTPWGRIPYETQSEVMAGFWEFLRQQVLDIRLLS